MQIRALPLNLTDSPHGFAAWIRSMDSQHGFAAWIHGLKPHAAKIATSENLLKNSFKHFSKK